MNYFTQQKLDMFCISLLQSVKFYFLQVTMQIFVKPWMSSSHNLQILLKKLHLRYKWHMLTDLQIKGWLKIHIPWNYKTDGFNEKSQPQGADPGTTEYKHHTIFNDVWPGTISNWRVTCLKEGFTFSDNLSLCNVYLALNHNNWCDDAV